VLLLVRVRIYHKKSVMLLYRLKKLNALQPVLMASTSLGIGGQTNMLVATRMLTCSLVLFVLEDHLIVYPQKKHAQVQQALENKYAERALIRNKLKSYFQLLNCLK